MTRTTAPREAGATNGARVGARLVVVLAALGTSISAYLTWLHHSGSLALCVGVGGCEAVQTSRFAMIGAVPVALVGLGGFLAILGVAIARLVAWRAEHDLALSLAATLYVLYLTWVEVFVLGAICPWCVTVAVCATGIFAIAAAAVLRPSPA